MGKMIKRFVQNEIKLLSESINSKVNNTFSFSWLKRKATSTITGVKESDLILSEIDMAHIDEVLVIEKGSGILLGNYSLTSTVDKDMISGMMTAIKSFVEDAFSGSRQNLESIEYELYTLHIQNFHNFYIVVVVSGAYTQSFEDKLEDRLLELSEQLQPRIGAIQKEEADIILKDFFESQST